MWEGSDWGESGFEVVVMGMGDEGVYDVREEIVQDTRLHRIIICSVWEMERKGIDDAVADSRGVETLDHLLPSLAVSGREVVVIVAHVRSVVQN